MSGTDHQNAAADSPATAAQPGAGPAGDISEVARVTLDSAEVANRAAKAAAQTANRAAEAANRFDAALAAHRKQMLIITGVTAGIAVLSLILFLAAAIQLRGRVVQVNSVVTVMAKRTGELKAGLDNLAAISERLDAFSTQIETVCALPCRRLSRVWSRIRLVNRRRWQRLRLRQLQVHARRRNRRKLPSSVRRAT
jgi:hypothetical protein